MKYKEATKVKVAFIIAYYLLHISLFDFLNTPLNF